MSDQESLNQKWSEVMRDGDCSNDEIGKLATEIGRHTGYFQLGQKIYNNMVENPVGIRDQLVADAAKKLGKNEDGNYSLQPVVEGFNRAVQNYAAQCVKNADTPENHESIFRGVPDHILKGTGCLKT